MNSIGQTYVFWKICSMNLRDLRYIVAVADHGQFGRAAQACAVSQPTLSGQILKLEKELGLELFERAGKVVKVTSAGSPVLDHARRAVAAADDVLAAAARQRDPSGAPLRLGIIPTLAPLSDAAAPAAVAKQIAKPSLDDRRGSHEQDRRARSPW
jgi:LysR family hydrogen peroxide-inducible transcriptional activator